MSDQLPPSPNSAVNEAAALRQTGAAPLRVGDPPRVGPFVTVALLGSGGMGRVYLARAADDRPGLFAVKVIRPEYAEDVQFQHRFEREAAVHSRLGPPHAPRLCGTGWDDQLLWMATEYIPGLDLADAVREGGALPPATVWHLVAELGRALAALAAVDVVHRDLKPSNVLLSLQGACVIDFGISKAADASAITSTGNRVGTPAYMSPEYLRTGHCDAASDVFSLAGTLLYAATGRAPFGDGTGVDVMHRVAFEEPNPEVLGALTAADPELGDLLAACLAKEPGRRPAPGALIDAAVPRAAAPGWPEPLRGRILARQRAYETLRTLPVERAAGLRPSDHRVKSVPPPVRASLPAASAAPDSYEAAAKDAAEAVSSTPPPSSAAAARPAKHRKRILAAAAGTALCAVAAAGTFVLLREGGAPRATAPGGVATASGTVPGGGPPPSVSGTPAGASAAGASSKHTDDPDDTADGGDDGEVGGDPPPPGAPAATGDDQPGTPVTAPADGPASSPAATPTAGTVPSEPPAPAWIADCTYYAGSRRTIPGDTGKRVLQVQCMLGKRGYDVGAGGVNGDYGPDTEAAVSSFQVDKGLKVNGIMNKATWTALRATD
ncbi:Serine/threonine protein kinase [Streptomyces sp. yr375]|uniref:serine/threonine-protein kinase n=1 Tax=Streptomyces sp. yr375 TaxID=1761906 RepID=UPI0008C5CD54|nr:serine/threonine-protein kinase [Streptomyces sp. yr375]SEP93494.1 Serine/threonine protein kinase [Streptomyces sp. yr375]